MKKIIALVLTALLALSLVACGSEARPMTPRPTTSPPP